MSGRPRTAARFSLRFVARLLPVVLALALLSGLLGSVPASAAAAPAPPSPAEQAEPAAPEPTPEPVDEAAGDANGSGVLDLSFGLPGSADGADGTGAQPGLGSDESTAGSPEGSPEGSTAEPSGVETAVQEAVAADGSAPVIIRLHEQADPVALAADARQAGLAAAAETRRELAQLGGVDPAQAGDEVRDADRTARATRVVDTLRAVADSSQDEVAALLAASVEADQASSVDSFWIFNGFAATVGADTLAQLAVHPDVASVTFDDTVTLPEPDRAGDPLLPTWSLEKVNAPDVWGEYGVRGDGIVVANMDSGVDGSHPALADTWRGNDGDVESSWFVPTGENYPTPGDGYGHGTHVMGSSVGGPPGEVIGVAPEAEWIAAKIFTDFGGTTDSIIHAGFQWMLAPGDDPANAPDVVNNSWGANDGTLTEYWDDVNAWVAAGIVPIFSNGNAGPAPGTVGSPASYPQSIGIGATDINDLVASFSSRGPAIWDGQEYVKPQISAPGVEVLSAWPASLGGGYEHLSGTSMAAPHATGVVALMLDAAPQLSVDDIRSMLEDTARVEPHMGAVPNNNYGQGIVDAFAAVTEAAFAGQLTGTVSGPDGAVEARVAIEGTTLATTSDATTGAYELSVPEGTHDIVVSAYGYLPETRTVTVVAGQSYTEHFRLANAKDFVVSGTVSGPDGPVAGAEVSLDPAPVDPVLTDADGNYALTVASGTYTLRVRAAGFAPYAQELVVDGPTVADVVLTELASPSEPGWRQYQNNPGRTGASQDSIAAPSIVEDWTVDVGADVVFSSPVIADGTTYISDDSGQLAAHDLLTGEQRWVYQSGDITRGTPGVFDGVVYSSGGLDGGLSSIDAETGVELWTFPTPGRLAVYATPTIVDGTLYFVTGPTPSQSDTVFALDPATGEQIWATDVGTNVYAGPAVAGGLVMVGNGDAGELIALNATDGTEAWQLTRADDHFVASPTIADGTVYISTTGNDGASGSVIAVDAATGELLWENDTNGDGQGANPAVYGDLVIAASHGLGTVTAYDRADGAAVWRYNVSGAVSASVMVTDDGYVIGGSQLDYRIWALDAATGELVWDHPVEANVTSSAAYAEGQLVTADVDGNLHSFYASGTVTGTVTGPDGPVPATVRIVETDTEVTADPATGAYEISHRPGTYTIEASYYGLEQVSQTVEIVAGRTVVVDFDLAAVGDGAITGTVSDEDGEPLAGATVTLVDTPFDPVTTGDDGGFEFDPVAAGTYVLQVALDGYAPLEQTVEVVDGENTVVEITLLKYQIGVTGDYDTRMFDVLTDMGYRVEQTTYADVTSRAGDFEAIVANGRQDDPGQEAFLAFLDATDAAGTSVVFLDQWGLSYGSIQELVDHVGDPEAAPTGYNGDGRVFVEATAEHPLTAGLPVGERVELLVPDNDWSSFTGYSGATVADLVTDNLGNTGAAIGYDARGFDSNHVLLGSLAAAASWGIPAEDWRPAAFTILENAVEFAMDGSYGEVTGTVSDQVGNPLAGVTVEVIGGAESTTTADDGSYSLFLPSGDHTLRFSLVGSTPVEETVTVTAGETATLDVTLQASGLGAVEGVVTSGRDGAPIEGATVTLVELEQSTTTSADGSYTLADVPAGTYSLTVSAAEHLTSEQQVVVASGETTTADVVLEPAPVVGVLGDYASDGVVAFLQANEVTAEAIDWTDVGRVGDFDVIVFNDPTDPGEQPFLDFLAAMDAAQVSAIFGDDWLGAAIESLLVEYLGDPEATDWENVDDTASYHPLVADHPLFEGIDGDALMFADSSTYAAWFTGYSGIPLAESVSEPEGALGVSVAYEPRTPGSIHLLLGGLAVTSIGHSPNDGWAEDAPQFYLNAISWAAAPGLGSVEGTVSDELGNPIEGATVAVVDSEQSTTTDADGAYVLPLPAGDYTLRFSAYGYTTVEHDVTVVANEATTQDVELPVGADVGTITGIVDSMGGVEPPGGMSTSAIEGATVALLGTPRVTTTDADGRYTLDLVEAGTYELEVTAEGFVRTRVEVTVVAGETTERDVEIRPSPRVGVIDEDEDYPHATGYLSYWGYLPEEITWEDTDQLAELDLVVANLASFPELDPGAAGWAAFEDAVNRAGVPVVWLDQFGRGSFQWLVEYDGDPATFGQDRSNDTVTATATVPDHPLMAGLPASFELVGLDNEYSWYGEFSGTTVATVASSLDPAAGGNLAGFKPRGAGAVDVLLGSLSISNYGWPAYGDVPAESWTPEAERLLRNGLNYALDTDGLGAEARGQVVDSMDNPIAATVTVVETGESYPARAGDGAFVVPLLPGTWTLSADAFGYQPATVEVTVEAGDVVTPEIVLQSDAVGTVAGTVTEAGGGVIEGATVTVVGTPLTTTTAADGTYEITGVPEGDWTLSVTAAGFQGAELAFTIVAGETTTVDAALEVSQLVAIFDDDTGTPLGNVLTAEGYTVEQFPGTVAGMDDLQARVLEFRLVIFNDVPSTTYYEDMVAVADEAATKSISVIFAGQFGGDSIAGLVAERGDPASEFDGFVEDTTIEYTPTAEHPIFAGFTVGEPITLMGNATENQQWLAYGEYTGTTIAELTTSDPQDGPVIGNGVGYRFTSDTSVEIILASLGASLYGAPDEPEGSAGRWTEDAVQVYLNAVAWATTSEQGAVTGTVTSGGEPVEGATVTAVELGESTVTAVNGTYTLGLPDGTHTIRVEAFGYEPAEQTVEIVDAATVTADFDLVALPTASLTGTVTAEGGDPVAGATVTGTGPVDFSTTTGDDGSYQVDDLQEGDYEVTVEAAGYVAQTASVTVTAGDPTVLDFTMAVIDIGVLGDVNGEVTALLNDRGEAAAELTWGADLDLSPYEVVVVNGGDPDLATFEALIGQAKIHEVSLVYTGTWAVDQGGIRILERYTDRVVVGEQGYGDSRVKLTGFDPEHPLFKRLPKPARILVPDSYYSVLDEYAGIHAANIRVQSSETGEIVRGPGVGYDWWSDESVEVLLSATAVSETQGPGTGWTRHNKRLLLNAVRWAADATAPADWDDGSTDEVVPGPEVTPGPEPTPDPVPTQPTPDPTPTDPTPTEPSPTDPSPSDPPAEPDPTPTDPPADPDPTPTDPPTDPDPSDPEPSDPPATEPGTDGATTGRWVLVGAGIG